jgi:hypothetical protein
VDTKLREFLASRLAHLSGLSEPVRQASGPTKKKRLRHHGSNSQIIALIIQSRERVDE